HTYLADTYEKLNRPVEALKLYEHAVLLPNVFFLTYYRLGVLRAQQGNVKGGIESLQLALRQKKDHPETNLHLAKLYLQQQQAQKATPLLWRLVRSEPSKVDFRLPLAEAMMQQEQLGGALKQYQDILRLQPNQPEAKQKKKKLLSTLGLSQNTFSGSSPRKVFSLARQRIQPCYQMRNKRFPQHNKGNLKVRVVVEASGKVRRVRLLTTPRMIKDKVVHACVTWTFRRAIFPRKSYPYALKDTLQFR
ncbi:MAG: tetratricopeptide repeat protein, partial [Myxococcota bacterium]